MNIDIASLIPFEKALANPEEVFETADKHGKAIILKENKPTYLVFSNAFYNNETNTNDQMINVENKETSNYKLQEAMQLVLLETESKQMHAAQLADIIFERKLYLKKDGNKAQYNQIRARCSHYPNIFETLPGNIIKLRDK